MSWGPAILRSAEENGVYLDPSELRDALSDVRPRAAARPFDALRDVCERLALRATPRLASVDELLRRSRPRAPTLLLDRSGDWVVVGRGDGDGVWVRDEGDADVRMSRADLVEAVGALDANRPIVVAEIEAALPLAPLAVAPAGATAAKGGSLDRVLKLLSLERSDFATCAIFAMFIGVTTLIVPIAVQSLVNAVVFTSLTQPLVVLALVVLATLAISAVLRGLQEWVVERLQQRLFVRAALDFVTRLIGARIDAFDAKSATTRALRFFDVVATQKAVAQLMTEGLALALQGIAGLVLLAFYHPWLLAFDIVLLIVLSVVVFGFGRHAIATSMKESTAKYATASWIIEVASNLEAFRMSAAAGIDRTEDLARGYVAARKTNFTIVFRQLIAALVVQTVASAALLAVGGWLVLVGQLTVGQLVAAEIVVASVAGGFTKLAKHLAALYDLATSLEKLGHVVDLPLERRGGVDHLRGEGPARLEVREVQYVRGGRDVLEGMCFTVENGRRIAVLGPHGSGKSSLADLVLALREPTLGSVRIDGVDLRELDPVELRSHVALVRGTTIFDGTIFENVTLSRSSVSASDVREALDAVGLTAAVTRLPEGSATRLSAGGHPLSRGEAQRLVLARALVGHPRLLIIDGLLDAMDAVTLGELEACLTRLEPTTTVLVLTADPDVARFCHDVVSLRPGVAPAPSPAPSEPPALAEAEVSS